MKKIFLFVLSSFSLISYASIASMTFELANHPLSVRCGMEMIYFQPSDEIILFGGSGRELYNDMWIFQNNEWKNKDVSDVKPNGKAGYGMCYNGSVLLVFGGYDASASLGESDELWSYDGKGWNLVVPETTNPAPRSGCAMTYDFIRNRLVLFGGRGEEFEYLNDTWEWDGSDWHQMNPATSPGPRDYARMVYFEPIGSVVLFGGLLAGDYDRRIWRWNGTDWQILPAGGDEAPEVYGHQLVFDSKEGRLILFGGEKSLVFMEDMWEWDGSSWSKIDITGEKPPLRKNHAMTYDPVNDRFIIFGGIDQAGDLLNDTWVFKDGQWTQIEPTHSSPCYRQEPVMAYDSVRDRTVLFGGRTQKGLVNDTWMWSGSYWTQFQSEHSPPAATFSRMVFDERRSQIVLTLRFDDEFKIWEWDGSDWRITVPAGDVPVDAGGYSLVYDSVRDVTVMFGGYIPYHTTNRLWEWDGTTWTTIDPDDSFPQPRVAHEVAFDCDRDRMVVFGGLIDHDDYYELTNETWEWDGYEWYYHRNKGSKPARRTDHTMVYDQSRRRTVMFGGFGSSMPYYSDTWEWDGFTWREITLETGPGEKWKQAAAYDSRRHRTIIFGGEGTDYSNDTWEYFNADTECCDTLGVTLELSQTTFHPGDSFACTATVCNNTGAELPDLPLFVLLEVMGHYYFGPTFSESVDTYLDGNPTYPENETEVDVIPPFTWPEGTGSFHGAYFNAALTDPDMTFLYGVMDSVEFGWETQ